MSPAISTPVERAAGFRRLHERHAGGILVLPNVWDAMSARVVEEAGARAIATTSAGVSWSLGRPDVQGLTRDEMIDAVRRIAATVAIPVTADIEGGYGGGTPDDVAETVRGVIGAGAVGINLEDNAGLARRGLLDEPTQAKRIAAARSAALGEGLDLFVNARVDVYLLQVGDEGGRFDDTVRRAHAYTAAGADGIFVPGVTDAPTIRRLAGAIEAPLNIMAGPGSPSTAELQDLGVARVSLGPGISEAVMEFIRGAAEEVLQRGTYETLRNALPFSKADALFSRAE